MNKRAPNHPSEPARAATTPACIRRRGRPTKRTAVALEQIVQGLQKGWPRCKAAKAAGMTADTLRRWLLADAAARALVLRTEEAAAELRDYYLWLHHPFRGCHPPRPPELRGLPYPPPRHRRR